MPGHLKEIKDFNSLKTVRCEQGGIKNVSLGVSSIENFFYVQPINFAYIRLLNKPHENEVTLNEQN